MFFELSISQTECNFIHFDETAFSDLIPLSHSYGTGKNYDEFKAFVACSQLKPIKGSELGQLGRRSGSTEGALPTIRNGRTGMIQQQQQVSHNNKTVKTKNYTSQQSERNRQHYGVSGGNSTTTGSLLEKEWRQQCQTFSEKALFMKHKLSPSTFVSMFQKSSLDPSFMSDLISVIYHIIFVDQSSSQDLFYDRTTYVLEWMEIFPRCASFNLNLLFMNSYEKKSVQQIIDWIDESLTCDIKFERRLKMLKRDYGVSK
jgi:hypothetical protein